MIKKFENVIECRNINDFININMIKTIFSKKLFSEIVPLMS